MIDIVSLLLILVILGMGFVLGVAAGRRLAAGKEPSALKNNPNICGCSHHLSFHGSGNCRWSRTSTLGDINRCHCIKFVSEWPLDPFIEAARQELTEKGKL